jgi:hypothetical protein
MTDRINFDRWIEQQIEFDQEIGGYDPDCYAAEMWASLDLTDDPAIAADEGRVYVEDLDEARSRINAIVSRELPRIQAERTEVENEVIPEWPND